MLEHKPKKVAIYCRVSPSGDEPESGGTIENQKHYAGRYVDLHEFAVHDYYLDDQVSGTVAFPERPGAARLLQDAKAGHFDTVLVYRLDRFARRLKVLLDGIEELTLLGIGLRSMTETFDSSTPSGRLFIHMLASFAEYERESILERTQQGRQRAAREGRWIGGITPFGYQSVGKRLVLEPEEAAIVARIFRLYVDDGMGLIPIANLLNAEGEQTLYMRRGVHSKRYPAGDHQWNSGTISRILKNAIYTGRYRIRRGTGTERTDYEVPPIVSKEVFNDAQQLSRQRFAESLRNSRRTYLLRGKIKCHCGRSVVGDGRHSEGRFYYLCPQKHYRMRAELIEDVMWGRVKAVARDPRPAIDQMLQQLRVKTASLNGVSEELELIERELASSVQEEDKVIALYRKGRISEKQLDAQLDSLQTENVALYSRRDVLCQLQLEVQAEEAAALSAEEALLRLHEVVDEIDADAASDDEDRRDKALRAKHMILKHSIREMRVREDGGMDVTYVFGNTDSSAHLPTCTEQSVAPTLSTRFMLMRVTDVAKLYGVARTTVWDWIHQGKMQSYRPEHGIEFVVVDGGPPERKCLDCGVSLEGFLYHRQRCNPCRDKRNRLTRHS